MTTKTKYDRALLDQIVARDGATLVGDYEKVNAHVDIQFICKCASITNRIFQNIVNSSGMFCKPCLTIISRASAKKTCTEKYGVVNPSQLDSIKEKKIETTKLNYGVDNPFKSDIVKDRIKETNLEKYGVESPLQNKDIMDKVKKTNIINYGVEHHSKCQLIKDKKKKTSLEHFGVDNPNKVDAVRNKINQTNFKKYGVEYTLQVKEIREKIKQTNIEKYGFESPLQNEDIKDKIKNTLKINYGVEHPMQLDSIKDKIKQTCIEKYGVEYPAQNPEVFEKAQKNAKRLKDFTMPSGAIRRVQGYEPFALRDLLAAKYEEEQIKTGRSEIPRIKYKAGSAIGIDGQTLREEKDRYYFPDIYIPHENRIIEVKSTWTYKCKTDFVIQKGEAAKAAGYNYECWIYNGKGERVVCDEPKRNTIIPPK